MGRLKLLEREINKGISVDEKSNSKIAGWSPNNVRRIIIGYEFAIVQYFVKGYRYKELVKVVDFRRVAHKDLETIQQDPGKYKSILTALTAGRICSSIEEVIFCKGGNYPEPLFALDTDISKISRGDTTLEKRFVRLRHISVTSLEVKNMARYIQESKTPEKLLIETLQNYNIPTMSIIEQHQDDWWKGVSLRPKYYSMDAETLPNYFNKLKDQFESQLREEKLESLSEEKNAEVIAKHFPAINSVLRMIFDLYDLGDKVFKNTTILSKAEWSSVLQQDNMSRGVRLELSKSEDAIKAIRGIDFDTIIRSLVKTGASQADIENLKKLREIVFNHILKHEEEYKRESNQLSFGESVRTLQKLTGNILNVQVNIVFLSLAKYLTRNTPKYADFFYNQLGRDLANITYTRSVMEYCNKHLEHGWAKQAMDTIQVKEVLVESFTIPQKHKNARDILISLSKVS